MKHVKKMLVILLGIVIFVVLSPQSFAIVTVDHGLCGDNLKWSLDSDGILTIEGTGKMDNSNTSPWEKYKTRIKHIIIQNGVSTIGKSAFRDCAELQSVIIPGTILSIDMNAFMNCVNLEFIDFELPASLSIIEMGAFRNCVNLKEIEFPPSLQSIENGAFEGCKNITDVVFPKGLKSCWLAFGEENHIKRVKLPNEESAYYDIYYLPELETVFLYEDNDAYETDAFGVLYDKGKTKLIYAPKGNALNGYLMPETITEIGESAFAGNKNIKDIQLSENVSKLGKSAFSNCSSLKHIHLSPKLNVIPRSAFERCDSLQSIILPEGIEELESCAFADCHNLTTIDFPDSLIYIDEGSFIGWGALDGTAWFDLQPNGVIYAGKTAFGIKGKQPKDTYIKEGTITINSSTFVESETLYLPQTLKGISTQGIDYNLEVGKVTDVYYVGDQDGFREISVYYKDHKKDGVSADVFFASCKIHYIAPENMLGDVDGDGNISAADARLALRRSVGLETYEEGSPAFLACDVDLDGNVSAADARLILRASVGLENPKKWVK